MVGDIFMESARFDGAVHNSEPREDAEIEQLNCSKSGRKSQKFKSKKRK